MKLTCHLPFKQLVIFVLFVTSTMGVNANEIETTDPLDSLENYQVNNSKMVSSGLPNEHHFEALKKSGVTRVIDLIPGDRNDESNMVHQLGLDYFNIQVDWDNPTLENFKQYVTYMAASKDNEGLTLTHCKLNWRGATFTYLYRVTQLHEPESLARQDLDAIWQPNETWQAFIEQVKTFYHNKES